MTSVSLCTLLVLVIISNVRAARNLRGDDSGWYDLGIVDYKQNADACATNLCGQTFDHDVKLSQSYTCIDSNGPTMTNGAKLNCNGYILLLRK